MRFILVFSLLFSSFFSSLLLASSPPIQLATKFHDDITIENYWVSEKLDGVRGYWDGESLISKKGNKFSAPAWFTKGFPKMKLDGELWVDRNQFERVSGIVRTKKENNQDWKQISFMIFDLPSSEKNFTDRLVIMQQLVDQSPSPYLKMIKQRKILTHEALQAELDRIIALGGEGLMLHHVNAYYQVKRSQDLMKLKRFDDAEAVVIGYSSGKGKHTGKMGALLVETESGIQFKIGSGFTDAERVNPPKIGDTITFQYVGKTKKGVPRFASYLRIRNEI